MKGKRCSTQFDGDFFRLSLGKTPGKFSGCRLDERLL
jgi:hypothetical protein